MRKASILVLLGLTFGLVRQSYGQEDSAAIAAEYFNLGMEVFDFQHRKQAKDLFVLAASYDPRNARANFMAGKAIMLTVHKEGSLPYFMKAWIIDPAIDEDILYWIGQAFHYTEEFDSAILFYELHKKRLVRSLRFQKSLKVDEVNRKVFECRNAMIYKAYPVDVKITNLGTMINSEWPEYAPTITADESTLVFTSRRPDDNVNPTLAEDLEYYEDVYMANRVNGQWQYARNVGAPVNSLYHNASINLAPDGSEMFIYSDNNGGDIYETFFSEDGSWTAPRSLRGEVNTEYLENSATITRDNQRLYFTSDRPGGYGGTDIYVAQRNRNGTWVNVRNLGPVINTEWDEDGAFISSNGVHLYFSSNGHAGMGDMDIYQATFIDENTWSEPLNLGYPINSVENDIYFTLNGDETFAYYSSVKAESLGEQDIYLVDMRNWQPITLDEPAVVEAWLEEEDKKVVETWKEQDSRAEPEPEPEPEPVLQEVNDEPVETPPTEPVVEVTRVEGNANVASEVYGPTQVNFELKVVDEVSLNALDSKVVIFSEDNRVYEPEKIAQGHYKFDFVNDSYAAYKVRITSAGYLPHVYDVHVLGSSRQAHQIKETIALQKATKSFSKVLNVYFAHGSAQPHTFEDIQYVETLMRESPLVKVEIAGHTDNTGPEEYNQLLSQRRAEAVKGYLVDAGIDASRILAVGYGPARPVADNDTRQGRRLNRRTEFTIIEN